MGRAGQWQGALHLCCGVGLFFFFSPLIAHQNTLLLPGLDSASVGDVGCLSVPQSPHSPFNLFGLPVHMGLFLFSDGRNQTIFGEKKRKKKEKAPLSLPGHRQHNPYGVLHGMHTV